MKRSGLLNPALSRAIARLGHTHTFVVADCGLPIPRDVEVIDLSVVFGIPRFTDVLDAVLAEVVTEGATVASEVQGTPAGQWLSDRIEALDFIAHEEFKRRVSAAEFVVRTGETTSYANVIIRCGVAF